MGLLDGVSARRRRARAGRVGAPVPLPWWRRHWRLLLGVTVAVVAAVVAYLVVVAPFRLCGSGLTAVDGSPEVCVGLDLDSTRFTMHDPLADLEGRIAGLNAQIAADDKFGTIVLLEDMTPNPNADSLGPTNLRDSVEGAITAAARANTETVAGGNSPKIKLLLASFGSGGGSWRQAVDAITQATAREHIVAVAGIGQSLDTTRQAVKALSDAGIVTVGSVVTADDMNQWPDGQHIDKFFRVAATNTDMAQAAVSYVAQQPYKKIMLVQDMNKQDSYVRTLSSAFTAAFEARYQTHVPYAEPYESPEGPLTGASRDQYMANQFAGMHADICQDKPDLVYFAGRGADLTSFLTALSQGGACGLSAVDIMTGDDALEMVGKPVPSFGEMRVRVFYTAEAAADEWRNSPANSVNAQNYLAFGKAYTDNGFDPADLRNGNVIMTHDAVLAAATAARLDPVAITDPSTVAASFLRYACRQTIPGASGEITFDQAGNPVDKAMPIMLLQPNGVPVQQDLAWSAGQPFDPAKC